MPSIGSTARLLAVVSSPGSASASISTTFGPPCSTRRVRVKAGGADGLAHHLLAVAAHRHHRRAGAAALHHLGPDGLVAPDDAEARRLDQADLPVALVGRP